MAIRHGPALMLCLQYVQEFLQRNAAVLVLVVLVQVYEAVNPVHSLSCAVDQCVAIHDMSNQNSREYVAGPREVYRYFCERQPHGYTL